MASGTQGYQKTTTDKSLADTLISEYKKLRKRSKSGGSDEPLDPANLKFVQDSVQAVDDFIVSGINGITSMFSTSASPVDAYDPVSYDDGTAIDVEVVTENKKQTALLEQQNTLLGSFIDLKTDILADSKRLRQEERMEEEEFLSGTQGYRGAIEKKGGDGILSKLSDLVQIVVGAKAALLALKAAIPLALKTALMGAMTKMVGVFKGLKLGAAWKGTKNFFGNMFKNRNVAAKDAVVNQKGNIVNPNRNIDNLQKVNVKDTNLSKNLKKQNNLLKQSNLEKVDLGKSVVKEGVEELVDTSGQTITKNVAKEGAEQFVEKSGEKLIQNTVKNTVNNNLVKNLDEGGKLIAKKPGLLKSFGTSALKSLKNPKNYTSLLISMTTGIVSDQVRMGLDKRHVNKNLEGFEDKSLIDKEIEIANMLQDLKKLQEQGKGFRPGEWAEKIDAIIGNITTLGMADRGNTDREQKIVILKKMLEKLKEMGYGDLIDQEQKKIDEGHYETNLNSKEEIDAYMKKIDETGDQSNAFGAEQFLGTEIGQVATTDLSGALSGGDSFTKVNGQNFFQTSNSTTTGQLKGLTEDDYNWLAYAISGEAAQGTDDIYGVAASILNRKARGDNDGSIESIIKAPGQFKAFEDGKMEHSPEIAALLQSKEGQAKLMEALRVLKGRTDFKGQSELGNRVASEDPMFDEKGNFFHYGWQTSGDSVKPEGWKPVNWQQYMPGEGIEGAKGLSNKLSQQVAGLSSDTSGAPTFIFIPPTTGSDNNSAGPNDGGTSVNLAQLPTENRNLDPYKFNSLQRLNA